MEKLFSFEGRLRRRDWWLYGIGLNVVAGLLNSILARALIPPGTQIWDSATAPLQFVGLGVALVLLWPSLALTVKRRHDCDRAGWPVATAFAVLVIMNTTPLLYILAGVVAFEQFGWAGVGGLILVVAAAVLGLVLLLGLAPGTPGPNRFGPSPRDEDREEEIESP